MGICNLLAAYMRSCSLSHPAEALTKWEPIPPGAELLSSAPGTHISDGPDSTARIQDAFRPDAACRRKLQKR
eukprot:3622941-Pyramimonas_sp.AAC.1